MIIDPGAKVYRYEVTIDHGNKSLVRSNDEYVVVFVCYKTF